MPSKDKRRAPARCALALALSLAFAAPAAYSAGLGRISVQSALGQPLRAEVEVTAVARDEAPSLAVALASQSAFRQANLEFNPALAALRFDLDKRADGNYVVRITSLQPVNEPYLDVLLELTWSTGRVLREYTVLLDPPALRAQPEVLPPVAARPTAPTAPAPAPTPAPAPVVVAPAPSPAPAAAVATPPAPAPAAPVTAKAAPTPRAPEVAAGDSYAVKSGDTLGRIASRTKPASVSLDQMLVALFQANPNAFAGNNMNRLIAGRTLTIPSQTDIEAISPSDARSEVVAQSADFAQYRSRLAQAAGSAPAPVASTAPAPAAQGRVTTKVEDKSAPATTGDQLKIAKAEPAPAAASAAATAAAAAAAKKAAEDEAIAKQRALKEQEERAAELKRTNEALKKALELQSKSAAQAQKQAEEKAAAATPAPTPAPVATPAPVEPPKVEATPTPTPEPAKAEEPKQEPPKQEVAKTEPAKPVPAPTPAPTPAPAPADASLSDMMSSPYVLGGIGLALLTLLVGLNLYRKRKVEKSDEFKATGEGVHANSLFGATGGQSVDTGATSTFNSSFIPAASQLDSNEVDPVAEADVYIAYGREEQAEDILKEALRLQPDRHAVRVKLLEIYSRRADKPSFMAVAQELRERTGGVGEDWERGAKLGRALDPSEPMFAGSSSVDPLRGPTTELRLDPAVTGGRPATLGGMAAAPIVDLPVEQEAPAPDSVFSAALGAPSRGPDTAMTPDTAMPLDSRMSGGETRQGVSTSTGPTTHFEATLTPVTQPLEPAKADILNVATNSAIDFSALDFDLTSPVTRQPDGPKTMMPKPTGFDLSFETKPLSDDTVPMQPLSPPARPMPAPTVGGFGSIPDVDLSLPPRTPEPVAKPAPAPVRVPEPEPEPEPEPALPTFSAPSVSSVQSVLEESLARPTLLGDVGALPDERAPRLTSNTDQATVPLIDFDLTGSDVELGGRRTETQAGSPLAAQMATKLDLARGYIDLGVKDGARELIEEVMRDGTREQRQSAVELMKQVES